MEEESRKFKNWHKRKLCRLSGTPETDSVSSPVVEARQLDSGTPDNSQYWHPPQYQPLFYMDTAWDFGNWNGNKINTMQWRHRILNCLTLFDHSQLGCTVENGYTLTWKLGNPPKPPLRTIPIKSCFLRASLL